MIPKPNDPIAEIQDLKERLYDLEQKVKLLAEQLDCFQILVKPDGPEKAKP
jgi:hypothetical protein